MRKFTPKGRSVRAFTSLMAASTLPGSIVAPARKPNPPALHVAAVSLASAIQPIAVCTTGYRQPSLSQRTVWSEAAMGFPMLLTTRPAGRAPSLGRTGPAGIVQTGDAGV